MIIQLTGDDPRLGEYAEDGSIKQWPAQDVFERPYEKINATVHRVSGAAFVVIGPDQSKHIDSIKLFGQGAAQVPLNADEMPVTAMKSVISPVLQDSPTEVDDVNP